MDLQLFLQVLSCCAIVTTIALFLCGIPICIEIMRRKGTKDISGIPFLMGLLGGSFWLRYGFLKDDSTMIIVNLVSVSLFSIYCLFYLAFANPRVPNGIGMALAVLQLSLFLIFPRKENGKSVVSHVAGLFITREEKDVEKGDVASTQTVSTGISLANGKTLIRKLSEALDKKSKRSENSDDVDRDRKFRQRTRSVPDILKFKSL
ncbi:mtN3/saliva family protein [Necator americanus]|uniref:Sugar transporter SWEET1 n=1 Tax=Necator americanus TaxID=51031 RepID=W2SJW6_NECAM|nr:mtN3/saliva family protein [Necator americanus]ETN69944.1 mtN3/saliva family protein [Necator americanus]